MRPLSDVGVPLPDWPGVESALEAYALEHCASAAIPGGDSLSKGSPARDFEDGPWVW